MDRAVEAPDCLLPRFGSGRMREASFPCEGIRREPLPDASSVPRFLAFNPILMLNSPKSHRKLPIA